MCNRIGIGVCVASLAVFTLFTGDAEAQFCPSTSATDSYSAAALPPFDFATIVANPDSFGVDVSGTDISLDFTAGAFSAIAATVDTNPGTAFRVSASLDENDDGLLDVVGDRRNTQFLNRFINQGLATPTFLHLAPGFGGTGVSCSTGLVGGDFNNDGLDDLVRIRCSSDATRLITALEIFPNVGSAGAGSLAAVATSAHATPNTLGHIERSASSMVAYDWNGDTCLDIILGNTPTLGGTTDGQISALISDCGASPTFTQNILISNIDHAEGPVSLALGDVDLDGDQDIVASSPGKTEISMWLNDGAGSFGPKQVVSASFGNAQGLFLQDFNGNGYPDLIWSVDSGPTDEGDVYFWANEADGTPFDSTTPIKIFDQAAGADLDSGSFGDFNNDGLLDVVVGDVAGTTGTYTVMENSSSGTYPTCGEVASGAFVLGPAGHDPQPTEEFGVLSARISAVQSTPAPTTINYYMSNTAVPTWTLATPCGPDFCVTFPTPSGRTIRWKAELCGDTASTPTINSVDFNFDYEDSGTKFAAGLVASNGIGYVGGFQDVGDTGKFFAVQADLTTPTTLWEAGAAIDAQATRNLFTTQLPPNDDTILTFSFANASDTNLQASLGVATQTQAEDVITWQTSARFGLATNTKFGAIVNSTAAVMTPPGLPAHYTFLIEPERSAVDTFVSSNSSRDVLVFAAGKAGVIHAIQSDPNNTAAVTNGQEAWGFIPVQVAQNFVADKTAFDAAAPEYVSPTRYFDGAPTLADVYDTVSGNYITNLIVGGGEASTAMTSLDVTAGVAAPTPLWSQALPAAGDVTSKPAVIRVDDTVNPEGKFMIVAASGLGDTNMTPPYTQGLEVVGMELDGDIMWRFEAVCPVTTDITAFETDDTGALVPAGATIDGFIDQVVFADFCGNVYLINVNDINLVSPVSPPVLAKSVGVVGLGTGVLDDDGDEIVPMFRTNGTAGALGADRPITGQIAARPDDTTNLVLYIGTGGHESVAVTDVNAFYAVNAFDGSIRSTFTGACSVPPVRCEKFYGGSVVTETQVLFTATVDAENSTCDDGSSRLILADNRDTGAAFIFTDQIVDQAVTAPVFAAANAVYLTTVTGEVRQIGETSAPTAGSNPTQASATSGVKGEFIATSGWRQLLY